MQTREQSGCMHNVNQLGRQLSLASLEERLTYNVVARAVLEGLFCLVQTLHELLLLAHHDCMAGRRVHLLGLPHTCKRLYPLRSKGFLRAGNRRVTPTISKGHMCTA